MSITPLPTAPSRSDTPDDFITKADAFLAALVNMVVEINSNVALGRTILGGNLDYYVRTDGSDANLGTASTSGGAWLTLQHAVDQACMLDFNGHIVTIHVADGTYTGGIALSIPWLGGGTLALTGDIATPASCIISTTSVDAIEVSCNLTGTLQVRGFKLQTTTSGSGIRHDGRGLISFESVTFGACATYHLVSSVAGGRIQASGNYTIAGNATCHAVSGDGGLIGMPAGQTVTLTGTPVFSSSFAQALAGGVIEAQSVTFSGSATGSRYAASANGVIYTAGAGATYLPGNSGGSTSTGGQYA